MSSVKRSFVCFLEQYKHKYKSGGRAGQRWLLLARQKGRLGVSVDMGVDVGVAASW